MKKQLKELKSDLKKELKDVRNSNAEDDYEAGADNGYCDGLETAIQKIDMVLNETWDHHIRYGKTE